MILPVPSASPSRLARSQAKPFIPEVGKWVWKTAEIPDDDAEKIQTIGDVISYVKEKYEA